MRASTRLFVYGTLRSDHRRTHRRLHPARFVGRGSNAGTLWKLGAYPGVERPGRRGARVFGEVHALSGPDGASRLAALDRYEGRSFRRVRVVVQLDDGRRTTAWAYVLAGAPPRGAREAPSGAW